MNWQRKLIEVNNLPVLRAQFEAQIKTANPDIEKIKCIFGYKDENIVYVYTVFEFLDKYQTITSQGALEKFYLYQLIDKKSIS